MSTPTLPLEPLFHAAFVRSGYAVSESGESGFTLAMFAEAIGFTERAVSRWRQSNALPHTSADRAATSLSLHPTDVWGQDWYDAYGDLDKILDIPDEVLFRGMKFTPTEAESWPTDEDPVAIDALIGG